LRVAAESARPEAASDRDPVTGRSGARDRPDLRAGEGLPVKHQVLAAITSEFDETQ
jgi:hypothetical protein